MRPLKQEEVAFSFSKLSVAFSLAIYINIQHSSIVSLRSSFIEVITMAKNKHLTYLERQQIEQLLDQQISIKKIAEYLGKSTSTITREIIKRAVESNKKPLYRITNRCKHRYVCTKHYLCEDKPHCIKPCKLCKLCNQLCSNFEEELCPSLLSPPYVCNGCSNQHQCVLRKKYYNHRHAHKNYRQILVESRTGVNIIVSRLSIR